MLQLDLRKNQKTSVIKNIKYIHDFLKIMTYFYHNFAYNPLNKNHMNKKYYPFPQMNIYEDLLN